MRKKFIRVIFIFMLIFVVQTNIVYAENIVTYPEKIKIATSDVPSSTLILGNYNSNGYYKSVSPIYEFYDENDVYNIVYVSGIESFISTYDNGTLKVHWLKIDDDEIKSDIILETDAELFGNAIYKDGFMYVIYGRSALESTDKLNVITVEITKYDTTGKIIGNLQLKGTEASNSMLSSVSQSGTRVPFSYGNPANCDVAMKDNILVAYFGRLSYSIHQSSLFLAVDTDKMTLKTDGIWKAFQNSIYTSHSMDQRVIVDSENNIITVDFGDGNPRGININKTKFLDENSAYVFNFTPFHFRESASAGYYYNNTYSSMGNIIELSDGYIFVNASDKTLSKSFLESNYGGPWNVFVQKYKKNFENVKTDLQYAHMSASEEENKNMQMLTDEKVRLSVGERTSTDLDKIHLRSDQNDYGVRWLTDFDFDCTIDNIRALKIDNERVLIIYERTPIKNTTTSLPIAYFDQREIYYMIIDKDANIVKKPVRLLGVEMSKTIHYQYKDGYVIWTTTTGNDNYLTVNKLKVDDSQDIEDIPISKIEISGTSSTITKGGRASLEVTYYPTESNERREVTWTSSNEYVATVNEFGEVKGLHGGVVTITATTKSGATDEYKINVNALVLNKEELTLTPDDEFMLEYVERYQDGKEIPLNKITYESNDNAVVTVDNNGLVKAIGVGETKVSVKINGYTRNTVTVKVIDYIKGDLNRNSKIDLNDIILLLKRYLGTEIATADDIKLGDMDDDGKLGLNDIIILLRVYLGTN